MSLIYIKKREDIEVGRHAVTGNPIIATPSKGKGEKQAFIFQDVGAMKKLRDSLTLMIKEEEKRGWDTMIKETER